MTGKSPSTKKNIPSALPRWVRWFKAVAISLFGLSLLPAIPAFAGFGLGVTPAFPPSVTIGMSSTARLKISNQNTDDDSTTAAFIKFISITPACAAAITPCPVSLAETGQPISIVGPLLAENAANCGGVSEFTASAPDPTTGEVIISAASTILIPGSPAGTLPDNRISCIIDFNVHVNGVPQHDAKDGQADSPSGIQTLAVASARSTSAGSSGTADISFPTVGTVPNPAMGTLGGTSITLTDTATIKGLTNSSSGGSGGVIVRPTGTVTFTLYKPALPGTAACSAANLAYSEPRTIGDSGCTLDDHNQLTCTTALNFVANAIGTWRWTSSFTAAGTANPLNADFASGCDEEQVAISPPVISLVTTQLPRTGTKGITALGDTAELSGAFNPKGQITFNLYPPSTPACSKPAIFTVPVAVDGNGPYSIPVKVPGSSIKEIGDYQWVANYTPAAGDTINKEVLGECGAEPVTITGPKLDILKTPGVAVYQPGQQISWKIVVTNNGSGTAVQATVSDPLPDPNSSLQWGSPTSSQGTCQVTGLSRPQNLNCNLGDLPSGASATITVSSPTQTTAVDPKDCGSVTPLVLDNTATASASNADPVTSKASQQCLATRLEIIKTPDNAIFTPGDTLKFSIKVTNIGEVPALGVHFSPLDALPDPTHQLNWSISTPPAAGTCTMGGVVGSQTLSCDFGELAAHASVTVEVSTGTQALTVDPKVDCSPGKPPYLLNNRATVVATNAPTVFDDGSYVCNAATITIVKTPKDGTYTPGDTITWTFVVKNTSTTVIAKNVHFSPVDSLPDPNNQLDWKVQTGPSLGGTCSISPAPGQKLTCSFNNLNPGQFDTVVVRAVTPTIKQFPLSCPMTTPVTLDNNVTVVADNAPPANDVGKWTCKPALPKIDKTPDGGTVDAGKDAIFTIKVSNLAASPVPWKNVTVTDMLPDGFAWELVGDITPGPGTCKITAGVLNCIGLGDLAPGAPERVITVKASTVGKSGKIDNSQLITTISCNTNTPGAYGVGDNASPVCNPGDITIIEKCNISLDKTCAIEPMIEEPFHCEKPVDAFKMKWAPNTSKDASRWLVTKPGQKVDLQVWNGFIGSPAPINVGKGNQPGPGIFCDVSPDEVVSVSGLNSGSKKSADVQYWEVFDADPKCAVSGPNGIKIGNSAFNIGCEKDMKDQTDCGKPEGDLKIEKGQTNLINDWLLAGITGKKGSLQCDGSGLSGDVQQNCTIAQPGDNVFYQYKVTNNGKADVNVTVTDDKKTTGPVGTFKIPGKDTVPAGSNIHTFTWGPVAINSTTVNVGTAIGNAGSNECKVTDKVIVTTPCFLGDPRNGTLYPYGTLPSRTAVIFNESEALQRLEPSVATLGQTIRMWYTDEHAMLLGVNTVQTRNKDGTTSTKTAPVTPYDSTKLADSVINPATGVPEKDGGTDPAGRPIAPSLFCTDITADPLSTAGDWQMMGTAQGPQFVSGTWKGANVLIDPAAARNNGSSRVITTAPDPARNGVTLGPGADPLPAGLRNQGYVSEVRWDVSTMQCVNPATHQLESLKPGHSYRMQFMVHDGDQNKSGGDVGEACSTVTIPD